VCLRFFCNCHVNCTIFEKKVFLTWNVCFDFICRIYVQGFSFPEKKCVINFRSYSRKVYAIFVQFRQTWIFCIDFSTLTPHNIKSHKILQVGAFVVPCGQTDRHDASNSHFSHLFKWPENVKALGNRENYVRNSVLCIPDDVMICYWRSKRETLCIRITPGKEGKHSKFWLRVSWRLGGLNVNAKKR
jgi:hypothetical protein